MRKRDKIKEKSDELWAIFEEQKAESKAMQGIVIIITFVLMYLLK